MERSNEYDNQTRQNEKPIIHINYEIEVDQIMEEKEFPSLQIEISKIQDYVKKLMKKRLNTFWNNYKFKEKNGIFIIKMSYVSFLLC
jgi:hypothetical protein